MGTMKSVIKIWNQNGVEYRREMTVDDQTWEVLLHKQLEADVRWELQRPREIPLRSEAEVAKEAEDILNQLRNDNSNPIRQEREPVRPAPRVPRRTLEPPEPGIRKEIKVDRPGTTAKRNAKAKAKKN
jgi:hypothetical protein